MTNTVRLTRAAEEYGVDPRTLLRALAEAGFRVPSPGRGRPRLISIVHVERALASRTVSIGRGLGSLRPRPPSL
jgi:hypothetical protein